MTQIFTTLINQEVLVRNLSAKDWVVVDCSYDLADRNTGKDLYLKSHINGAVFADVRNDLSGPPMTDHGRHPLPTEEALNELFSRLGISHDSQVIVYDNAFGGFAGRLWWVLRYMGHQAVAVLDGGRQHWVEAELSMITGEESNNQSHFQGKANRDWLVTVDNVPDTELLIDSRDPERYRGEVEPLDRAAGHIPSAINRFWKNNLENSGCFKDSTQLREEIEIAFGGVAANDTVFYCGSGVTACHNILAVLHAGLGESRLYAGSWSDWCSDPGRPIAIGEKA